MSVYKRRFKNGYKWCVYLILPDGSKFRKVIGTKKEAEKVERLTKEIHFESMRIKHEIERMRAEYLIELSLEIDKLQHYSPPDQSPPVHNRIAFTPTQMPIIS